MAIQKKEFKNLEKVLTVNRPIQVVIRSGDSERVYRSLIADYQKGQIYITPLARDGKSADVSRGQDLELVYFGDDAVYECETHVIGHKKENNIVMICLEKPHKCLRVQRREFFRLACILKAMYRHVRVEQEGNKRRYIPYGKKLSCCLADISGGGICFNVEEELEESSYIQVELTLPNEEGGEEVKHLVHVLQMKRKKEIPHTKHFEYTYGGRFVLIKEEERQKIIRFTIRRQIELRDKTN